MSRKNFYLKSRVLKRYQEFFTRTKGISTHVLCKAASGSGVDYSGCTKARLAEVYALEDSARGGSAAPDLNIAGINAAISEYNDKKIPPNSPHRLEHLYAEKEN